MIDFAQLLPFAIFGGITAVVWAIMNGLSQKQDRAVERLEELRNPNARNKDGAGNPEGMSGAFQKAAPVLSKVLKPKTELEENALKIRLANAGFNSPNAATFYSAIRFIALIVFAIIGSAAGFTIYGLTEPGLATMVITAGLGFYIPGVFLWLSIHGRKGRIFLSLPDALDLLVVCVEAGLSLDQGLRRVSEEMKDVHKDLCAEFDLCNFQLQMGRKRRDVLHDLGVRTGVDDVKALSAILIQADKFGSSIAQALRVQSDSMRVKRMQIAEEKAQKTAVQMLFPLVLFIFPGIFVVLVGPAAIMMIDGLFTT